MLKDLGKRPIELTWLKVQDIDLTTGIANITGAKHTIGREGKLKANHLELLKRYIKRNNLNCKQHNFSNSTSDNLGDDVPTRKKPISKRLQYARTQTNMPL